MTAEAHELLLDGDGRIVATYAPMVRDGLPCADRLVAAADAAPEAVARALLGERAGWLVGTDDRELAAALLDAGAGERRHAWMLELDLAATPRREPGPPPAGVALAPLTEVPDGLAELSRAAYPPGHPDHHGELLEQTREKLRDAVLGRNRWVALAGASRIAWRGEEPVGAVVLNRLAVPSHPEPIAWVTELFRAPGRTFRGVGGVLLDTAVGAAREHDPGVVGLAVSAGNDAHQLYARRGFVAVAESWTLALPP